jgi:glycerol-3-phosphate dehydrogenase
MIGQGTANVFEQAYDLAIIGGGLTGAAIARDAAGRGLSVFLCEQGDLASGASSATDRLVHGGLHHLGRLAWGALRTSLTERDILLRSAPHLVRPVRFVLPHHERQWPRWAVGAGLKAYDRLARRSLPPCRPVDFEHDDSGAALRPLFRHGFAFSDCVADDARLVVANAIDARQHGASVNPRTRCVTAERERDRWRLTLESQASGEWSSVSAGVLVNATGAAAGDALGHVIDTGRRVEVRLFRHATIVVRRSNLSAYALPNGDGRVIHVVPHEPGFALIGSIVSRHSGLATDTAATRREVAYLLDAVNQYLHPPLTPGDVVQHRVAITALPKPGADRGTDHAVVMDAPAGRAPVLSVFGGTLTTHRRTAEEVVDRIARFRKIGPAWTAGAQFAGGNFPPESGVAHLCLALRAAYPFLSETHAHRLALAYGTRATNFLAGARSVADLGPRFGIDLTAAEVGFLKSEEWAVTGEDVLWRRSRLGLRFSPSEADNLGQWLGRTVPAPAET